MNERLRADCVLASRAISIIYHKGSQEVMSDFHESMIRKVFQAIQLSRSLEN